MQQKKIYQERSSFFSFRNYMMFVALGGQFAVYFQAFVIFTHHSARDVSLTGFLIQLFCGLSWLMYGVTRKDRVLIIANILGSLGAFLVALGILIYGRLH